MRFLDVSQIRTRFDQRIPAFDGTELSVDVYLPPERGRYPVLLNRTAADNNRVGRAGISSAPAERWKAFAAQGYIVAAADVRGRGDSDGQFIPFVHEAADGAATVAWLRTLDECNGQVGLLGSGYGAFCAWAAAVRDGHIDALVSISPFGAVGTGLVHRGGCVRLDWLFWMHLIGGRTVQPPNAPCWKSIHRHWPLVTMDEALGRSDIWWRQWLQHHDSDDAFWKPLDLADHIAGLNTPGLHITGWWDGQAQGARYFYAAARRSEATQELIVGPWDTATVRRPVAEVGGFDFGPRSVLDLDETIENFFSAHLRGELNGSDRAEGRRAVGTNRTDAHRTRLFVTGRNEWQSASDWLITSDETLELHLSSAGGANTRRGDGVLSIIEPKANGVDTATHNPEVPVDFQPQFVSFVTGVGVPEFTLDQAHLTARDEALIYTAEPLKNTITVVGCPIVNITICTAASDADLYVLLSDSFPLGTRDLHLTHAALRLATLKSFTPGVPITVALTLGAIAHDFLPGHQIRLSVTFSLFPLYARNPQATEYISANEPVIADMELRHGPHFSSFVQLPLAVCRLDGAT